MNLSRGCTRRPRKNKLRSSLSIASWRSWRLTKEIRLPARKVPLVAVRSRRAMQRAEVGLWSRRKARGRNEQSTLGLLCAVCRCDGGSGSQAVSAVGSFQFSHFRGLFPRRALGADRQWGPYSAVVGGGDGQGDPAPGRAFRRGLFRGLFPRRALGADGRWGQYRSGVGGGDGQGNPAPGRALRAGRIRSLFPRRALGANRQLGQDRAGVGSRSEE